MERQKRTLGDNLVGSYVRGSLALSEFDPQTSDVDVLTVTRAPPTDTEFEQLTEMHLELAALDNPYALELEITYLPRGSAWHWNAQEKHPTLSRGAGQTLSWALHGENWLLERRAVREHGVTLSGPPPETLFAPVSDAEVRTAVRRRLEDWKVFALTPGDPDWSQPNAHHAYVIETMCRALQTLRTGRLGSKPEAVAWAEGALPERWHSLVSGSRVWRTDGTVNPELARQVQAFVLWAVEEAERLS